MTILCYNIHFYWKFGGTGTQGGSYILHRGFLHVKISVSLFRLYIKWSLVLKHVCAGRGNVTFGVYNSSRLIVVTVRHSGLL